MDAAVRNPERASQLRREAPELLDARWLHQETALHFLAVENQPDAVSFLAASGMDVDATNAFGDTALIDVVFIGNVAMSARLLELGADPNAKSELRGCPLHIAVQLGREDLVELLLRRGATTDYVTSDGETLEDALRWNRNEERLRRVLREC